MVRHKSSGFNPKPQIKKGFKGLLASNNEVGPSRLQSHLGSSYSSSTYCNDGEKEKATGKNTRNRKASI